jgi:diaminohydroxyphosphoribosylaminopyrimidine deaminase/5-amino-6-(5-phosphoribosylamino)uracil reductase
MISYKTLNKDNPKLNCRLRGFENFSPKRIILDNKLNTKMNSYIFKTANKKNTLIFYNKATRSKVLDFKRSGVQLIKSKINRNNKFDMKILLKKLYKLGCRNLLIEGGDIFTNFLIRNKIFNKFYLFKSNKNLSKSSEYLKFNSLNVLNKKYKIKTNLNLNLMKDKITLYK